MKWDHEAIDGFLGVGIAACFVVAVIILARASVAYGGEISAISSATGSCSKGSTAWTSNEENCQRQGGTFYPQSGAFIGSSSVGIAKTLPISPIKPARTIKLTRPDGRSATINFEGNAVRYDGDLPVDDAAKAFFDAVFKQMSGCK